MPTLTTPYRPTQELFETLERQPARQSLIPMECRASWWIPVQTSPESALALQAFYYPVRGGWNEPKQVGRPLFLVTIDPTNGRLLSITDLRFQDFAPDVPAEEIVGELTKDKLPAQTIPELEILNEQMSAAYDRMLPLTFRSAAQLTQTERKTIKRFRDRFEIMAEPFLIPFYRALNPRFFEWLKEILGGE